MLGELDQEEIRKTSISLKIPTDFVRKDYYVTNAIHALSGIEDKYFDLIFKGGTSLSKGYQVIRRLSEDVDFRITQKPPAKDLGKGTYRKRLREFRYKLIDSLLAFGFKIPDGAVKVFYEGRFMRINAEFDGADQMNYLKPHVAIECFVGDLALQSNKTNITSLMKLTLGEECEHPTHPTFCVALDETAAEKWVALTRRVANSQIKSRQSDKHLVRHLYDLYHLTAGDLLTGDYRAIVGNIIQKDRSQFKKYNDAYTEDPISISKNALGALSDHAIWRNHWEYFLEQMVYEAEKPSFDMALGQLQIFSQDIFNSLDRDHFI